MFNWHKKEKPLQGLTGLGGGVVSRVMKGAGGAVPDPGGGPFSVTGGNATSTAGGYKYFYFTSPGNLSITNDGTNAPMLTDFMLVGQGGQGGFTGGGGGAAGAFIQKINYEIGPFPGPATCPVALNTNSHPMPSAQSGQNSIFTIPVNPKQFTAPGGGGGPNNSDNASNGGGGSRMGSNGGSPGVDPYTAVDDNGNTPDSGIRGAGGDGLYTQIASEPGGGGGGGGGAGGDGADAVNPSGPPGGSCIAGKGGLGRAAFLGDTGIPSSYGTSGPGPGRWFAGGGGGGNHDAPPPNGGAAPDGGGGGAGGPSAPSPVSGTGSPATGGGGGGGGGLANAYPGPLGQGGGSGILIVRIATSRLT